MTARARARARVCDTPTYGHGDVATSLVLIFPLLLAYELGVVVVGAVNGVDVVTRALYAVCGGRTAYLLVHAAFALAFLIWIRAGARWQALRARVVAPVVLEAAVYACALLSGLALLMDRVVGLGVTGRSLVAALGAGVHEELVFRLGLMCALASLLRGMRRGALPIALVGSAALFALAHHAGPHGEALTAHALAYRLLAGCAFGAIFWYRSLAHAVYAHVLYDLLVAATS
jgi:hypothetical protein